MCYSGEEKRSDYIKNCINWTLFNNNSVVLEYNSVTCHIIDFDLIFKEKDALNKVNLNSYEYVRENDEFILHIDFKKGLFSYKLKNNDEINIDNVKIFTEIEDKQNKIILKYAIDETEVKRIEIEFLELDNIE